jgi:uncharacterized caspase-like protein
MRLGSQSLIQITGYLILVACVAICTGCTRYSPSEVFTYKPIVNDKRVTENPDDSVSRTPNFNAAIKIPNDGFKPDLWVLSVGVSNYSDKSLRLKYARNDAKAIAIAFRGSSLFRHVHIKELTDSAASRENILNSFATFLSKAAAGDVVVIFMAGHGVKNLRTGSYYYLPFAANTKNLIYKGLKWSDFDESVKILSGNVNKIIILLDTCHSGAIRIASRGVGVTSDLSGQLKYSEGIFILSSSKAGEDSLEEDYLELYPGIKGHGIFTYSLISGLNNKADFNGDGVITVNELFLYVSRETPKLSSGVQHPYFRVSGTDIPIQSRRK